MSKLKIELDLDNSAFCGENITFETAKILKTLSDCILNETRYSLAGNAKTMVCYDTNGNRVGQAQFKVNL